LTSTLEAEKAACEAYRPVLANTLEKDFNIKLLALGYNPPGAIWCAKPISGLADLKGKKVRTYNQALSDFVAGVGGVPLNIPYADTIPSLNSGVIDCAITGTLTGNTSKFFEVTTHLYPLSLGWGVQFWGVNLDVWNTYSDETKAFVEDVFKKLEARVFEIAQQSFAQGVDCNIGKDTCTVGLKANMVVVEVDKASSDERDAVLQKSVFPGWAKRCGSACAEEWNVVMKDVTTLRMPTN
jgi:TRAP-type C4-dicarboxylate transport system substrate-binding protein